jgi:hypothetical protein
MQQWKDTDKPLFGKKFVFMLSSEMNVETTDALVEIVISTLLCTVSIVDTVGFPFAMCVDSTDCEVYTFSKNNFTSTVTVTVN